MSMITCDWWDCQNFDDCVLHLCYSGAKYPPCASCVHFDFCDVCTHQLECAHLVSKFLPNMFRRLVRDIRLGEDTSTDEQFINRNTCGGRKRP